jgi:hypothetical protein
MLEKTVKEAVKKRLNELGAYHFWAVQMGLGGVTLDCLVCYKGTFYGIETKAPGKKPTLRQEITMQKIRDAGGEVFVIDNIEDARRLFDV